MAHIRACIGAVALALAGVLSGRVDLVVLATPFAAVAMWALMRRPTTAPAIGSTLAHRSIREGEATTWTITITPADSIDVAAAQVALDDRWQLAAPTGVVTVDGDRTQPDESLTLGIDLRSLQWGRRQIGPALVAASSAFGAFRFGPTSPTLPELTTLPLPTIFDSSAPVPSPAGLIGLHRSRRRGDGTEFATIRPFTVGDRLRRVNWPVSLRTGALHVATTHADSDTDVLLVVDATIDAGTSGGIDGPASSLDRSVRGAGAIAAHFLRHGDGVALRAVGSTSAALVQVGHGTPHLRRILGQLATIEAGGHPPRQISRPAELARLGFQAGGLALVLSPLLSAPSARRVRRTRPTRDDRPRHRHAPRTDAGPRPGSQQCARLAHPTARTRPHAQGTRARRHPDRRMARTRHRRPGPSRPRPTRRGTPNRPPMTHHQTGHGADRLVQAAPRPSSPPTRGRDRIHHRCRRALDRRRHARLAAGRARRPHDRRLRPARHGDPRRVRRRLRRELGNAHRSRRHDLAARSSTRHRRVPPRHRRRRNDSTTRRPAARRCPPLDPLQRHHRWASRLPSGCSP